LITRRLIIACIATLSAFHLPSAAASAGDGEPAPIVVKDALYGEVLFYFYQED